MQFILSCSTSLRGASNVLSVVSNYFGLPNGSPVWQTGRLWLFRLGYYKLMAEKEKANDWIWIIDHTVQMGTEKCLIILGVRQSSLSFDNLNLMHEDVEPIDIFPVNHSNGDVVCKQLIETVNKTGVPRQIVADYGSDIKSGVEKFCAEHARTQYTYDIKHKTAAILKRELKDDAEWNEFTKLAAKTGSQVRQTELAAFAPPNQRSKARYMNVDKLGKWGLDTIYCLENENFLANKKYDPKRVEEKLGWLKDYKENLNDWEHLFYTVNCAANFVRTDGLYIDCHIDFREKMPKYSEDERATKVQEELILFVKEQAECAEPDERMLGSSEIIESLIGRFKSLEQNQAKSGFTSILLGLPALIGKTTQDVIHRAIENIPTKKIYEWVSDKIGPSVQSQKKEVIKFARQRE